MESKNIKEIVNFLKGKTNDVKESLRALYYDNQPLPQGVEDEVVRLCNEYQERQRRKGN